MQVISGSRRLISEVEVVSDTGFPGRFAPIDHAPVESRTSALVASELIVTESGAGDTDAAHERLEALKAVILLNVTAEAEALTRRLLDLGAVPRQAAADAAHIAIAATNGADYLITWNFRHIANAAMRSRIEQACRQAGYRPPVICTPSELMEVDHASNND